MLDGAGDGETTSSVSKLLGELSRPVGIGPLSFSSIIFIDVLGQLKKKTKSLTPAHSSKFIKVTTL